MKAITNATIPTRIDSFNGPGPGINECLQKKSAQIPPINAITDEIIVLFFVNLKFIY